MKDWVARALHVNLLENAQLKALQAAECGLGRHLANWEIQDAFHIPTIRERLNLPDLDSDLASYARRIENEIISRNLVKTTEAEFYSLEWLHSFDWNVYHNKGKIVWEFSGPKGRRGGLVRRLSAISEPVPEADSPLF